jgi:cytochrome c biogenesis protein CcdA
MGPDPEAPSLRRSGFGAPFWFAMGFSLVLILAGAVVGFLGPRLFPARHAHGTPPAAGLAIPAVPAK